LWLHSMIVQRVRFWMPQETGLTDDGMALATASAYPRALWLGAPLRRLAVSAKDWPTRSEVAAMPLSAAGGKTWRVWSVVARDGVA
jgi:hypothetical protein